MLMYANIHFDKGNVHRNTKFYQEISNYFTCALGWHP